MTTPTQLMLGAIVAFAALVRGTIAGAETYPSRPITVIVPFAGGSASDVVTRIMVDRMSRSMGQPIIIDNRPGAGGDTGTAAAAKAAPDGYTLVASGSGPPTSPASQNVPPSTRKYSSLNSAALYQSGRAGSSRTGACQASMERRQSAAEANECVARSHARPPSRPHSRV